MKKTLIYLLNLICWFVRHTMLVVFSLMVFSMFVGVLLYLGYMFGYETGMNDAFDIFNRTQEFKQFET